MLFDDWRRDRRLGDAAHADGAGDGRGPGWLSAQRSLAADLLEERDPQEVARIQRQVLVPLQLWLIETDDDEADRKRLLRDIGYKL